MKHHLLLMSISLIMLLACSCSKRNFSEAESLPREGSPPQLLETALPPLPRDDGSQRLASSVQTRTGDATWLDSDGAVLQDMTAILDSAPGESEWAIYEFDSAVPPPQFDQLEVQVDAGIDFFIGLSNYTTGRWEFSGPYFSDQTIPLGGRSDSFSNGSHTYIAVLGYDDKFLTVSQVSLTLPSPVSPDWIHMYGEETDFASNQVDENLQGLASDAAGNVYALSNRRRANQPRDSLIQVLRYDKDGNRTLAKLFGYGEDIKPQDIAVDSTGNIYVAAIDSLLELFKLAPDGTMLWARTYDFDGFTTQFRMRLDSEENIFVAGSNDVFGADDEYGCVAKFSGSNGTFLWGAQWPHAFGFENLGLATVGTDVFILDDNDTASGFESHYPMLVGFDTDGSLIDSQVLTKMNGDPLFGAFTSESMTAHGGKILVGGMAQEQIDSVFTVLHQVLVMNPDMTEDHWFSGAAQLPDVAGTTVLDMRSGGAGELYMLGVKDDDSFNLVKFGADELLSGAWDITAADTFQALIVPEYHHDAHRAQLAMALSGSIYVGGSSLDPAGLTLQPYGVVSHALGGKMAPVSLSTLDLIMTASDIAGVNVTDPTGMDDEPGADDDTLVMRLTL